MNITHITTNGNTQSVELPQGFRFDEDEICIHRQGDIVVLYSKETAWNKMLQSLNEFTSDYMEDRNQPETSDERDWS